MNSIKYHMIFTDPFYSIKELSYNCSFAAKHSTFTTDPIAKDFFLRVHDRIHYIHIQNLCLIFNLIKIYTSHFSLIGCSTIKNIDFQ